MTVHLTPMELGREVGIHRREVIAKCMEFGVPIFQGRIDRDHFKREFFAARAALNPDPPER